MARKGTAGRSPVKQSDPTKSGIDKMVEKTKEAFDGENEATDYKDVEDEMEEAKDYSKDVSDKPDGKVRRKD